MRGHSIDEAADGEEALSRLASEDFDLMVLDVSMPRSSGLAVARRLRDLTVPRRPLVLMLSAMATRADREEGLAAGADEYAIKPFPIAALSALVERMLAGRENSAG